MKQYAVTIQGTTVLLQHRFGPQAQTELADQVKRVAGQRDFTGEWIDSAYLLDGKVVHPAEHIYQAMIRAASNFRIKGRGKKTYEDLVSSAVIIEPDLIPFEGPIELPSPEEIPIGAPKEGCPVFVDIRPVRIQKSRVLRERLGIAPGWRLSFNLTVTEEDFPPEAIKAILDYAGQFIGIGDYRPRFGRFMVIRFEPAA